jgi:hypothetical protein
LADTELAQVRAGRHVDRPILAISMHYPPLKLKLGLRRVAALLPSIAP